MTDNRPTLFDEPPALYLSQRRNYYFSVTSQNILYVSCSWARSSKVDLRDDVLITQNSERFIQWQSVSVDAERGGEMHSNCRLWSTIVSNDVRQRETKVAYVCDVFSLNTNCWTTKAVRVRRLAFQANLCMHAYASAFISIKGKMSHVFNWGSCKQLLTWKMFCKV